jgi:hypothetical protein
MKPTILFLILAACTLGTSAPTGAAPFALSLQPITTAAAFDEASFLVSFRKAMEIGAQDQMQKLIRKDQEGAVHAVISLCDANSAKPNEKTENEINSLRIAWNGAMKTRFVEKAYEYYSLMDNSTRADRYKLVNRYNVALANMIKAEANKDITVIKSLGADFKGIAMALTIVGDDYYASLAWLSYGRAQDETLRGAEANLRQAAIGYDKCIEHRDRIDLHDLYYTQSKERLQVLEAQGYGKDGDTGKPGADKPGKGKGGLGVSLGAPIVLPLTFAVEPEFAEIERPFWSNDTAFSAWTTLGFTGIKSTTKFPGIDSVGLVRDSIKSFEITSGGEKSVFIMGGKFTPCEIRLGDAKLPWAFMAVTGTKEDIFQGVTINMEPSDVQMTVYIAPASKIAGELGGIPIEIYDDTMSGAYGDAPLSWGHVGMSPEQFMFDFDSIRVDGSKHALPWSRYQKVGDVWYDMAVEGHTLTAAPIEVKTGKLKLKFKGPKPKYVILKGRHQLSDCYFDLASSKKGIDVPAGEYELFAGFIAEGKRTAVKKVVILPGENTPSWKVEEGDTTEITLGGPFGFDFETEDLGDKVKVLGGTIVVTGIADERYERPWNSRPYPLVSLRKVGSKKGGKPEKMKSNLDQSTLYSDWGLGYHPQDLDLAKKKGLDAGFEAQLTEKKNKLFGKIESEWKPGG